MPASFSDPPLSIINSDESCYNRTSSYAKNHINSTDLTPLCVVKQLIIRYSSLGPR